MTVLNSQSYMNDMLSMTEDRDEEIRDEDEEIENQESEVTEFFNGLNILVTGGSGFLGKLLVEKLLRSCPKIGKLYMLMRAKKGKTSAERFKEHFDDILYDRLKREQPDFINHVVMIEGDTGLGDLGLSNLDREKLIENVNVIFHGAATVRFDESLRRAITINVRGTKLLIQLAKQMKNLKSFVHISTAFSHCILKQIEEKYYDPPMEPEKVLTLIEVLDDDLLEYMTTKLLGEIPNTYAFSKALGEEVVRRNSEGLPVCIVRPSIMIATAKEPVPGWINNFYGPTGVVVGAGVGLLRSLHCERENIADIIPADYVINNIIVAAWDMAKRWEEKQKVIVNDYEISEKKEEPIIYNTVSSCQKPIDWGAFCYLNECFGSQVPSEKVFWHYMFILNRYLWVHNICCFFLHTIPGAIVDTLAFLTGHKPMMLKAYRKIHKFSGVISYFCTQQWKFDNKNVLMLWKRTSLVDRKKFYFNLESLDWTQYFYHHVRGVRYYILKDPLDTIDKGRVKFNRLKRIHYAIVTVISLLFIWVLYYIFLRIYQLL